ncbi:MAG: signal peptide peptidase SppA [Deferribacterales bacterium]
MKNLFRFFGKAFLFFLAFAIVVRIISVMGGMEDDLVMQDSIAVVRLEGIILNTRDLGDELKKLDENDRIKGVILEINSPGGAIAPTEALYLRLQKMKKPVYAVMESLAASGGYYTAAGCDRIYAMDTTTTGSIGVIMEFSNIQGLLDKIGVKTVVVKSGKMKDVPSPTRPMTKEEEEYLQGSINDFYEMFIRDILKNRPIKEEKLREVADGRVFSGRQAKELKLIDKIGTREEAVEDMKTDLGMPDLDVREYYEEEKGLVRQLLSQAKNFTSTHMADGQIYYLYRPGL